MLMMLFCLSLLLFRNFFFLFRLLISLYTKKYRISVGHNLKINWKIRNNIHKIIIKVKTPISFDHFNRKFLLINEHSYIHIIYLVVFIIVFFYFSLMEAHIKFISLIEHCYRHKRSLKNVEDYLVTLLFFKSRLNNHRTLFLFCSLTTIICTRVFKH